MTGGEAPEAKQDAGADAPAAPGPDGRPLSRTAAAAVISLARALEVFDPTAARWAALRAQVADRLAAAAGAPARDHADAVTGALMAEVSILLTHVRPVGTVDVAPDAAAAMLSAGMLRRLPGLAGTSRAVQHQHERWDGSGGPHGMRGPDIPLPSRLLAVAATLVGHPGPEATPNWSARRRRVDELSGTVLDPDLVTAAVLERTLPPPGGEQTLDQVLDGLERFVPPERDTPVEALQSIGAAVQAADSMPDLLLVIAEQAGRALGASAVSIGRIDHERLGYETLVNVGELVPGTERFPVDERHTLRDRPGLDAVLTGDGFVRTVDDGRVDDPGVMSLLQRELRSEAAAPIVIGDAVWGVVWASTRDDGRTLDHDDLATLNLVAGHAATAVTQAERIAEFEELALRDPLTGLGNRRVLEERLAIVFERPPLERRDVAVVMCDVDGLKTVNDTEGHAAGDELLVQAATALREAAATVDGSTVCRIGGDEFCVILDGGGLLSARPVTDLALRLFARTGAGRSLSCGIALADADMASPGDLLRAADEAQYEEKRRRKGLPPLDQIPAGDRRRVRRDPD